MTYNFLNQSFIPENDVKLMLVDGRTPESILDKLSSLNIGLILTDSCDSLHSSISYHPDIHLYPLGNGRIVVSPEMYISLKSKLSLYNFELIIGESRLKSNYPENIAYNVARIGETCFHNKKFTDPVLKEFLQAEGTNLVHVNQGYSKCSAAIINSNAIITSDKSIHDAAENIGIESLLITPGYIELEGLSYGFIGGCTGLIAPHALAVTGALLHHPDYNRIQTFLKKQKTELVCLSDNIPVDLGSLIPLIES